MIRHGSSFREFAAPLNNLHGELNRLVDHYWPAWAPHVAADDRPGGGWVPAVDVYETPDHVVLVADLPGVEHSAIDLSIDGRVLTLKGEKPGARLTPSAAADHAAERRFGSFLRNITLPTEVNVDAIEADFRLGVLEVRLPKVEAAKTRQIPIQPS
jgi:HSP20 family protein